MTSTLVQSARTKRECERKTVDKVQVSDDHYYGLPSTFNYLFKQEEGEKNEREEEREIRVLRLHVGHDNEL